MEVIANSTTAFTSDFHPVKVDIIAKIGVVVDSRKTVY
jgi:hypothetical protein